MSKTESEIWQEILNLSSPAILKNNLKLEYDGSKGETKIIIHPEDPMFEHLKRKARSRNMVNIVSIGIKISVDMMGIQGVMDENDKLDLRITTVQLPLAFKFLNQSSFRKKHKELVEEKVRELKKSAKT